MIATRVSATVLVGRQENVARLASIARLNMDRRLYVVVPLFPARTRSVSSIRRPAGENHAWTNFHLGTSGSILALAFVLTNTGLMAAASLQGTKVTRLASL
ncbi:hypothetical protein RI103_09800 [Paraburkholderia sp. FT54]|uniref:hypothetical protein n=1 Tax=Paraburkholderia sp. FT54 TaxID=3074437 RepID=UPI002877F0E6|nr:hypothetical protein [Paraburkholderia sp. FT54]WNC91613.1 hypothetical protein RI103_09800 [Paraburkholderia sp. FT54]